MNRNRSVVAIVAAALLLWPTGSYPAFPVVDLFNLHQAIERYQELQNLYVQGKAQLQQVELQYQLALSMARYIQGMPERYRARFAHWRTMVAPDTYGNTSGWTAAENLGGDTQAAQGYAAATAKLRAFDPDTFGKLSPQTQTRLKSEYATINLSDGATSDALATVGAIRARAMEAQRATAQLQADSLSTDPALNTRAALLNKISVANVMALRANQSSNQLLAVLAEEAAVRQKQNRDQMVRQLDSSIEFRERFLQTMQQFESGMNADQQEFRFRSY